MLAVALMPPAPSPRSLRAVPAPPDQDAFAAEAAELAPDSPDAIRRLFEVLVEAKKPAEAETAARAYLAPGPQKAAWVLAGCMTGAGLLLWGMVWFIARKRRAAGRAG